MVEYLDDYDEEC
jgi:chromosome segregation ATPase